MAELTPEFWVNLGSTVFFACTVVLTIWGIYTQKKQFLQSSADSLKIMRLEAYATLRGEHADIVKLQIEKNEVLSEIWFEVDEPEKIDETKWTNERQIFLFYVLIFDLYERIHWQIMKGEILDDNDRPPEWEYWLNWLEKISKHWLFAYAFDSVKFVYEEDFVASITKKFFARK